MGCFTGEPVFRRGIQLYLCEGKPGIGNGRILGMSGGAQGLARFVAAHTGEDWHSYDGVKIFRRANNGDLEVLKD